MARYRNFAQPMLAVLALLAGAPASARPHDAPAPIEHAQLVGTIALHADLFHVQGIDLDSAHIWVTSVDTRHRRGYLQQFDRTTGALLARLDLTDGPRYHPGGFSIASHAIWVPVAEYRAHSSAVLEEIDPDTLQVRQKIRVADHIGCVAATDTRLIAGNWDSRRLYLIDPAGRAPMRVVRNPSATRYQDMKFADGDLVAGGPRTRHRGTIDWIDVASMRLIGTLQAGPTRHAKISPRAKPYTAEGMTLQGRDLYVLPEGSPGRVFHFRLDEGFDPATSARGPDLALAPG